MSGFICLATKAQKHKKLRKAAVSYYYLGINFGSLIINPNSRNNYVKKFVEKRALGIDKGFRNLLIISEHKHREYYGRIGERPKNYPRPDYIYFSNRKVR